MLENGIEIYIPSSEVSRVRLPPGWDKVRGILSRLPFAALKRWTVAFPRQAIDEAKLLVRDLAINVEFKDNRGVVNVVPAGVDKGSSLKEALKMLGVEGWIAAVGDGLVDLDLFRVADFKATVSDAEEEVKKAADYVASRGNRVILTNIA